ncbi:MAG: PadR family transcriptional regulator [Rhodothermaceae bacterium]
MKLKYTSLGELEEIVLLIIGILDDNAYGISIMQEIEKQVKRKISISAVHTVVTRLESKGFLKSSLGGETNERGGRKKRFFVLTTKGKKALEEVKQIREKLWGLLPG